MNFDKLDNNKSSPNKFNFEEKKKVIKENKKKKYIYKSLKDNKREV